MPDFSRHRTIVWTGYALIALGLVALPFVVDATLGRTWVRIIDIALLFTILAVMIRLGALKRPGLILGSFIAIYGFARIIGEFFREPDPQLGFLWGGLTMGMLLSVPMIIAGAIIIVVAWRRKPLK